ncbi:hypothetical protein, partial [Halomonas alkalicola]|uniref:hypothetical protein n=1 Tax=Halomonas alkalicola TaxID=1930622 RepID=UPI0035EC4495
MISFSKHSDGEGAAGDPGRNRDRKYRGGTGGFQGRRGRRPSNKKRFFVVSRGFGLVEQASHRAANQVDHGDEIDLV